MVRTSGSQPGNTGPTPVGATFNMKRFFLFFALFLFSLFVSKSDIFAAEQKLQQVSEGQINEAVARTVPLRFLPTNPFYSLVTLKETLNRFFQPSSAKRAEFDEILSQKRLKEAYMLLKDGNTAEAGNSLVRYTGRLEEMDDNLDKARSQNQDVMVLVSEIANDFKDQEILLAAIANKEANNPGIQNELQRAIGAFDNSITVINKVSPGLKNRFKILPPQEASQSVIPAPSEEPDYLPPSSTNTPRKIIY